MTTPAPGSPLEAQTGATPVVSIVIPVHNDEDWISTALDSCLAQSLEHIEVICVDDASTDGTRTVIQRYADRDARVRLVAMESNVSALQCRRAGVMAAAAEHILFLDGDDELAPHAAARAVAKAQQSGADLVGFGVEVINPDGESVGGYQARLRHRHVRLEGAEILTGLFPQDRPAQGQLWRYLFSTALLREAYGMIPEDLVLRRVNDLPVMFLVAARARRYVSLTEPLYKYHFRRGGSGHMVDDLEQFRFYMGAVDSIEAIADSVEQCAQSSTDRAGVLSSYRTARLSMVGNVLGYLHRNVAPHLRSESLALLQARVPERDIVTAALRFAKDAVPTLAEHGARLPLGERPVRHVLLVTATLTTGGVSGVLLSQARFLLEAGIAVTVAARRPGSDLTDLPAGATFVEVSGDGIAERADAWADICERESIDLVIDHQVLYIRDWPAYALMARSLGVPTIGWIHNFSLRPVYDGKTLSSFLATHLNALATVVTLSPLDVAFWKLRGAPHAAYLPNPPSPLLLESAGIDRARSAPEGVLSLVWVGRLDQHTKQVSGLVDVAVELKRLSVPFRLDIIGPGWAGLTVEDLTAEVARRGVSDSVRVTGPLRGPALVDAFDSADLFLSTSVIEGYQLTLAEAQSRGVPVAMYELPWLTLVQGNEGLLTAPQGDAAGLAAQIASLTRDPERYAQLSRASLAAAARARDFDFSTLYQQLVAGQLPAEFSPEPTLDDARALLDWTVFFAERQAAHGSARSVSGKHGGGRKSALKRRVVSAGRRAVRIVPSLEPLARRVARALRR